MISLHSGPYLTFPLQSNWQVGRLSPLQTNCLRVLVVLNFVALSGSIASGMGDPSLAQTENQKAFQAQHLKSQAITLEELKDADSFSGAGTVFQLASAPRNGSRIIFAYSNHDDATGMRINNQLVKLKHIRSKTLKAGKGSQGLGKHVVDTWSNDLFTVVFDYRITSVGERGVGLRGNVTIQTNGEQASFFIIGGIGC